MGEAREESEIIRLRRRAEHAIRRARGMSVIEPLLTRILELSDEDDDHTIFAHRHLAEVLIEHHPWRAALHLRRVIAAGKEDDVVHALMGLCQALLGNFHSAVSFYRRALSRAPRNPWYHHNLGHLLDVALSDPDAALEHLRAAHIMEPLEHEITASLAHCLAGLKRLEEAGQLAREASDACPDNADHRALVAWIEDGAPDGGTPRAASKQAGRHPSGPLGATGPAAAVPVPPDGVSVPPGADAGAIFHRHGDVVRVLERGMREGGFSAGHRERALALWADFQDGRTPRFLKPEVYAAAIEYAIVVVHQMDGRTQAAIARRYGIAPGTLSSRFGEIRDALALQPGDPRYASS